MLVKTKSAYDEIPLDADVDVVNKCLIYTNLRVVKKSDGYHLRHMENEVMHSRFLIDIINAYNDELAEIKFQRDLVFSIMARKKKPVEAYLNKFLVMDRDGRRIGKVKGVILSMEAFKIIGNDEIGWVIAKKLNVSKPFYDSLPVYRVVTTDDGARALSLEGT